MGKKNEGLMQAAKDAIDEAWNDQSVGISDAVSNMKELIEHCQTNQRASESDLRSSETNEDE